MLWEAFYPRIRHENDPVSAAQIVVRYLRERITISDSAEPNRSIAEIWESGIADQKGFERIYVAALRAVGVSARLGPNDNARLFYNDEWRPAPRPLFERMRDPQR